MLSSWIYFGAALFAAILFCWAYQQWLGWLVLLAVAAMPALSLLLSLPGLFRLRPALVCPDRMTAGQSADISLDMHTLLPTGKRRCRIRVSRTLTGERWTLAEGAQLPAAHCGVLVCQAERLRIYDFLGLVRLGIPTLPRREVYVMPQPVPMPGAEEQLRLLFSQWRPKPGGGFGENHEMRLYRPGDSLNQIHWKLSAKMGSLIIREPMERLRGRVVLAMTLAGTPDALDRKLGRLLWMSRSLLKQAVPHEIRVMTGTGGVCFPVTEEDMLMRAMDHLLAMPPAAEGEDPEIPQDCVWQYRIGGDPDEG